MKRSAESSKRPQFPQIITLPPSLSLCALFLCLLACIPSLPSSLRPFIPPYVCACASLSACLFFCSPFYLFLCACYTLSAWLSLSVLADLAEKVRCVICLGPRNLHQELIRVCRPPSPNCTLTYTGITRHLLRLSIVKHYWNPDYAAMSQRAE